MLLKLTHRVGVSNPGGVHLEYEVVEFAFQSRVFLLWNGRGPWLGSNYIMIMTLLSLSLEPFLDPIRCRVLEMVETVKQT